jgi:hypothetical protein
MIAATNDEIRGSFAAHKELRCDGRRLHLANAQAPSITINLRVTEPHQLIYLARLVAHLGYEEIHFRGAYLWITTWGIWNTQEEAIGFKILEQFRRRYGENRSLAAAPGNYFRDDEFTESVCCLLQPMVAGWDAYYVPRWAFGYLDYLVSVNHDGFINIEVSTQEMRDKAMDVLRGHDWIEALLKS